MEIRTGLSSFTSFLLLLILIISTKAFTQEDNSGGAFITRSDFPDDFLFGVGTSAYQIEGAYLEDGKGLNDWDVFVHNTDKVYGGATGDIADDHYHRYLEDIERIHSLGVDIYRFSISWARILPKGKFGDVNPAGIKFYDEIIDNLLLKGVKPFVTIHHVEYPQELQDRYGAWLSPLMQEDFVYFAETCFKHFGDRVKYWITINEPNLFSELAYMVGGSPPCRCSPPFGNCSAGNSDIEPLISMHNMLLSHAKTAKLYRQQFQSEQDGTIGIVIQAPMVEPWSDDENGKDAVDRALAYNVAWALDPLVFGHYPPEMRLLLGSDLPRFTSEETELIKDSIDFVGINHYGTLYAIDCLQSCGCVCSEDTCFTVGMDRAIRGFVAYTPQKNGVFIGEPTGLEELFVVPRGIEGVVNYVKNRYNNKPMFITENGYSFPVQRIGHENLQNDINRIEFHKQYLAYLAKAIRNGADVRGYILWTLMDDFEWTRGYRLKFGLYSVDRRTLDRSPRASAKWYRDFLRNKTLRCEEPRPAVSFVKKGGGAEML